jgi:hypothetical protein
MYSLSSNLLSLCSSRVCVVDLKGIVLIDTYVKPGYVDLICPNVVPALILNKQTNHHRLALRADRLESGKGRLEPSSVLS